MIMGVGDGSLSKEIFEWFDYARQNILQQRIKPSAERTSLINGKDTTAPRVPAKPALWGEEEQGSIRSFRHRRKRR